MGSQRECPPSREVRGAARGGVGSLSARCLPPKGRGAAPEKTLKESPPHAPCPTTPPPSHGTLFETAGFFLFDNCAAPRARQKENPPRANRDFPISPPKRDSTIAPQSAARAGTTWSDLAWFATRTEHLLHRGLRNGWARATSRGTYYAHRRRRLRWPGTPRLFASALLGTFDREWGEGPRGARLGRGCEDARARPRRGVDGWWIMRTAARAAVCERIGSDTCVGL